MTEVAQARCLGNIAPGESIFFSFGDAKKMTVSFASHRQNRSFAKITGSVAKKAKDFLASHF